jgi:hypothetical protein
MPRWTFWEVSIARKPPHFLLNSPLPIILPSLFEVCFASAVSVMGLSWLKPIEGLGLKVISPVILEFNG